MDKLLYLNNYSNKFMRVSQNVGDNKRYIVLSDIMRWFNSDACRFPFVLLYRVPRKYSDTHCKSRLLK